MINLSKRSSQKELMDGENIPFAAMALTLKELNIINKKLGGHAITIEGVRKLVDKNKPLIICEIGCGGGDNLFALHKYIVEKNIPARFIGIDISRECIVCAKQQYPELNCEWMVNDYKETRFFNGQPDIIFSSLFCHHFTNEQLVEMLHWMENNSRSGFFINDLHRNRVAYYLIRYITAIFSRSYMVKNDAALSVARGFHKKEWLSLFQKAAIPLYSIHWKWAFRWLVIRKKNNILEQ